MEEHPPFPTQPTEEKKEDRKRAIKDFALPGAILLAALIIGGALLYNASTRPEADTDAFGAYLRQQGIATPTATKKESAPISISVTDQDHILGDKNAPVTIVEFSDFECPFCKQFHTTLRRVLQEYDGEVKWVYKHFPIDQLHPKARKEAEGAECANELGGNEKFWAYADKIFEITPSNNKLDPALLPQIAEEIGLNRNSFEECLATGKYAERVQQDYELGVAAGVTGTPGSFVNGQAVVGAVPYETLKA